MSTITVRWERAAPPPDGTTRRAVSTLVRRAVRATLDGTRTRDAQISVALVADTTIAALNEEWLDHAGPTDVISFPLFEGDEPPVGDVYVGVEQAARQARVHEVDAVEEIVRLAIHGTLHVLGWDHPDGEARLRSPMWDTQERLVGEVLRS